MIQPRFCKVTRRVQHIALLVASLFVATAVQAQFTVSDNFDRPDGSVGLGWSAYGNGAQISGDQLESFGYPCNAGGATRALDVTFPLTFAFDFSTTVPSDGGWMIGFNAAAAGNTCGNGSTSEVVFYQAPGGDSAVGVLYQTSAGPVNILAGPVKGQRSFTAIAHISGTVNADLSANIKIKYNDGLKPPSVTIATPAPSGAILQSFGSFIFVGNSNATYGPHFIDNLKLTLQ